MFESQSTNITLLTELPPAHREWSDLRSGLAIGRVVSKARANRSVEARAYGWGTDPARIPMAKPLIVVNLLIETRDC